MPYSLTPEWWLDDDSRPKDLEYVDVIKLHGSIDWYDREPYDAQRLYFQDTGANIPDRHPLFGPSASVPVEALSRRVIKRTLQTDFVKRVLRVPRHRDYFPIGPYWEVVPFLLPPAHDKLLGYDPIRALWRDMHRAFAACSAVVVIGYSMPSYDGYAYEALGRLLIDHQAGGSKTFYGHRRVPVQLITKASSKTAALNSIPFLKPAKTRVWHQGFTPHALEWLDWGDRRTTPIR